MRVDDEGFFVLDVAVLVGSLHESLISYVHIGTHKHHSTYIKWNYIQFYFIKKINIDIKFDFIYFFTLIFASLFTHLNGYGLG